jgi:hypothetical protein
VIFRSRLGKSEEKEEFTIASSDWSYFDDVVLILTFYIIFPDLFEQISFQSTIVAFVIVLLI